ncbi:hypothetical protein GC088_12635 [Arthrobacter sp. JZ12]|uniref:hypothetical protein n=1 Tax=Arthrobacter sp. JZ12 TaxID=2654190 RepID=UPI002B46B730|nr:hypothetical protein [Arthrobacter sp. JZ12]WRH25833.1 hypothetical protein GC088_12635 [Arthrobacter sp. JZ12]
MSKLTSVTSLALAVALLAGCGSAPAEEPNTRAASSESASPSTTPSPEPTEKTNTPEPESAPEPAPEPTPEQEPTETAETPEEPVPTIEPLPVGPHDPFVPPPHGEPNPELPPVNQTPPQTVGPNLPHSDPAYFLNQTIEPLPNSVPTPSLSMQRGGTLTVVGGEYEPAEQVYVMLGKPQTDYNYIQGSPIAVADQNGLISFPISVSTELPVGDYVVMIVPVNTHETVEDANKKWYNITLTV